MSTQEKKVTIPSSTLQDIPSTKAFTELLEVSQDQDTTQLLQALLAGGVALNASDIHLEALEQGFRVRVRLDGLLQDLATLNQKTAQTLLSRLKLLSGLKLNVADRAQDGRFTIEPENQPNIEVRTASLPAEHGESLVLRLLNPKNLKSIPELGLRKELTDLFAKEIAKPNGMIIVTGPTGSGKTTTLYAFLQAIQKPETKIVTIEDPIEYHLQGISQTQVNPAKGYDFALGLRAIVRQDPDVILVGEIRDQETANIAIQAALTGHLVFTTLHTNDAPGVLARLTSMDAKPENIGAALNLIIAQRLVRTLCKECRVLQKPTKQEQELMQKALEEVGMHMPANPTIGIAKGCSLCQDGYTGRIGVFEAIAVTEPMEEFISKGPTVAELRKKVLQEGMVPMRQDGILKVLQGVTTLEEVNRVTTD